MPRCVARQREALGDRQAGAGVAAVEHVVLALGATREAADAAELAQRAEVVEPAGQQLVRVGLVAGVPDDLVGRAESSRRCSATVELDDAERAAQVAAGLGDGVDDRAADVGAELASSRWSSCLRSCGPFSDESRVMWPRILEGWRATPSGSSVRARRRAVRRWLLCRFARGRIATQRRSHSREPFKPKR